MSANESKGKYEAAKKAAVVCHESIRELQIKCDDLQNSLPGLSREVENAEKAKLGALDNFAMTGNKQTESALKAARAGCEDAQKKLSETHELIEATTRALKKQESELVRLNQACELSKRQSWQAVFDEIRNNIPAHIFNDIKRLFVAGGQCSMTRQFLLDSLFPNHSTDEFQTIRTELVKKYGIE